MVWKYSFHFSFGTAFYLSKCFVSKALKVASNVVGMYRSEIEDICFFDVNTKYILSNVLKISVISRVRSTSENSDISNT